MTLLWIALSALLVVAALFIAAPFMRSLVSESGKPDPALEVYKDQLAELDNEGEADASDEESGRRARLEIERRIIAAAASAPELRNDLPPTLRSFTMLACTGLVVIGSTVLYAIIGSPTLPSASASSTAGNSQSALLDDLNNTSAATDNSANPTEPRRAGNVNELIVNLAAKLKQNPNDAAGWRMLGWSYFNTQQYDKSSEAYGKAVALAGSDARVQSAYGEALVRAANGLVTEKAKSVFEKALELDKNDSRARFFKGLAMDQAGDPAGAVDIWIAVLNDAPPGSEWIENLNQRVKSLAAANSIDITGRMNVGVVSNDIPSTETKAGPTAEDVEAAAQMTADDRRVMIRGMVDRLDERLKDKPQDADGWIRLMRSRVVLGETELALKALRRATEVFSNQPDKRKNIVQAAGKLGLNID